MIAATIRSYATAVWLNLALVSTILVPPERVPVAQVRIVTNGRRFRDSELLTLADGGVGVLSVPLETRPLERTIGEN